MRCKRAKVIKKIGYEKMRKGEELHDSNLHDFGMVAYFRRRRHDKRIGKLLKNIFLVIVIKQN